MLLLLWERLRLDLLIEALERVGAPGFAPVLLREVQERHHVVA